MMLICIGKKLSKTVENLKITANDGKGNDFNKKCILTNNTHSYKVVMAEWSMQCLLNAR
jgi:hypothetical protein